MELSLPESLYSPEQLEACQMELEQYIGYRHGEQTKQQLKAKSKSVPMALSPELADLLGGEETAAGISIPELEKWQQQLKDWLQSPVVHLTFAVLPTPGIKRDMVKWFRGQISPHTLLNFSVNRNIVGGLVVRTPGRIYDFSFRHQFLQHQGLITEIMRRV